VESFTECTKKGHLYRAEKKPIGSINRKGPGGRSAIEGGVLNTGPSGDASKKLTKGRIVIRGGNGKGSSLENCREREEFTDASI